MERLYAPYLLLNIVKIRDKILSNSYADLLKEEERVANNYLDELIKKYGN